MSLLEFKQKTGANQEHVYLFKKTMYDTFWETKWLALSLPLSWYGSWDFKKIKIILITVFKFFEVLLRFNQDVAKNKIIIINALPHLSRLG